MTLVVVASMVTLEGRFHSQNGTTQLKLIPQMNKRGIKKMLEMSYLGALLLTGVITCWRRG